MKKIRYNSPVVLTFALASLVVLILGRATGGWTTRTFFCVYRAPVTDVFSYLRLFGHVLGHSGFEHYIGNMTLILVIGPILEEKYGSRSLLAAIAITALASGLIHCLLSPSTALLGASGVVFMFIMLASLAGMEEGSIPLTMILVAIIYIGGEVVAGVTQNDGISHLAHIIGGLCGTGFGFLVPKLKGTRTGP